MKNEITIHDIISHIRRNETGQIASYQSNEEHCLGVANLAKQFADEFGMGEWGYMLGLLHDKGKEKQQFQEYIRDVNGISGHSDYSWEGKAHAYVGALMAHCLYGNQSKHLFCNYCCPLKLFLVPKIRAGYLARYSARLVTFVIAKKRDNHEQRYTF